MNQAQLIQAINALVEKGDKARDKAQQYYAAAGLHLKTLREESPSKAAWQKLIKSKCGLGSTRAYELIQIADGRKTVSDVRLRTAERMRKHRSCPSRDGQNLPARVGSDEPAPAIAADGLDDKTEYDDDQTIWRRGLLYRARETHGNAMFEDWSQYKVDDEIIAAVKQATMSWQKLLGYLESLRSDAATAGTEESETTPSAPISDDLRPAIAEGETAEDDQDADPADPVPSKRKKSKEETDLADAVNTAFHELAELASECREVVDNAPEGISETERIQTLDETASVLEDLEKPNVASELADIKVSFSTYGTRSRAVRRDGALGIIEACVEALSGIDGSDPRREAANDLREELNAVSEAENCVFPGMFG
jgi:hypothetical protein